MEKYEIVKLKYLDIDEYEYVAILRSNYNLVKVKLLKQPRYELYNGIYADKLFKQYCHEDDYVDSVDLNYEKDRHTFYVADNMLLAIDGEELFKIMKHLLYINFFKDDSSRLLNQKIYSEALERLYYYR